MWSPPLVHSGQQNNLIVIKIYQFGQLIMIFLNVNTLRLLKTAIMFCSQRGAKKVSARGLYVIIKIYVIYIYILCIICMWSLFYSVRVFKSALTTFSCGKLVLFCFCVVGFFLFPYLWFLAFIYLFFFCSMF